MLVHGSTRASHLGIPVFGATASYGYMVGVGKHFTCLLIVGNPHLAAKI